VSYVIFHPWTDLICCKQMKYISSCSSKWNKNQAEQESGPISRGHATTLVVLRILSHHPSSALTAHCSGYYDNDPTKNRISLHIFSSAMMAWYKRPCRRFNKAKASTCRTQMPHKENALKGHWLHVWQCRTASLLI
jgi:hypothetical protein